MAEVPEVFNQEGAVFVLLPTGIKFPPIEKGWQEKGHSFQEAAAHKGNVGILAGNGFIGLDQDDPAAFEGLELPITTTWETRPGRFGMWFKVSGDVPAALGRIGKKPDQAQLYLFKDGMPCGEIKLQRTYQVIPPSWKILEGGARGDYKLVNCVPPTEISFIQLIAALTAIGITFSSKSKLESNATKLEEMGKEAHQRRTESDESRARRYAEAALEDEVKILGSTPTGNRNEQLNRSAFALGQFVAAGVLSEAEVVRALSNAAMYAGLEMEEIRATITSGLEAGAKHPRMIPVPNRAKVNEYLINDRQEIRYEDITFTNDDGNDKISPTKASAAIIKNLTLAMSDESEETIYHFDGQIYRPDGERIIDLLICGLTGDLFNAYQKRETIRRIRNVLLDRPVEFEPDPYLFGVKNGVVNLRTGEFRDYQAEDLLLEQADVIYDATAKCPGFLAFLESITPDPTDRLMLIDWFAATAIKEPLAYVLFLLGLGRNGKGIFEKVLKRFFGQSAFRDMPLSAIEKSDFAASEFYKKRGWIASETGKRKSSIGTDFIKLTSGNGVIDANVKGKNRIQYEPYFQTIVDTNTMPQIDDNSLGWKERFCKANLPYIFVQTPDPNNPLEKQRDPYLFEKLSTPGELSGILNLVIFRAKEIAKTKAITKRSGNVMFAEYADQSASVGTFLELFCEYVTEGPDFWTPSEPIYEAYKTWCGYKVGEVVDIRYFGKLLKDFCGGVESKKGKDKDRKSIRLYKRLNFDSTKYNAALKVLRISMSPSGLQVSPSGLHDGSSNDTVVSMSPLKVWNDVYRVFGGISSPPYKEETEIFMETMGTMETSTSGGGVDSDPHGDYMETFMETNSIKDELLQAEEQRREKNEHFSEKAEDPGFQRFKARISKHQCCLCGRSFPYPLTPYYGKDRTGYICTTCHMEGPPSEPEKVDSQTKLEAGA